MGRGAAAPRAKPHYGHDQHHAGATAARARTRAQATLYRRADAAGCGLLPKAATTAACGVAVSRACRALQWPFSCAVRATIVRILAASLFMYTGAKPGCTFILL